MSFVDDVKTDKIPRFPAGMKVRITKLGIADKPRDETAKWEDFKPGQEDEKGRSIPVDYIVVGMLGTNFCLGAPVVLWRTQRNDTEKPGYFQTSPIRRISTDLPGVPMANSPSLTFETLNSLYRIEPIEE